MSLSVMPAYVQTAVLNLVSLKTLIYISESQHKRSSSLLRQKHFISKDFRDAMRREQIGINLFSNDDLEDIQRSVEVTVDSSRSVVPS